MFIFICTLTLGHNSVRKRAPEGWSGGQTPTPNYATSCCMALGQSFHLWRHRCFTHNKRELDQRARGPFLKVYGHTRGRRPLSFQLPEQGSTQTPGGRGSRELRGCLGREGLNKNPSTLFLKGTPSFLGHKSIC